MKTGIVLLLTPDEKSRISLDTLEVFALMAGHLARNEIDIGQSFNVLATHQFRSEGANLSYQVRSETDMQWVVVRACVSPAGLSKPYLTKAEMRLENAYSRAFVRLDPLRKKEPFSLKRYLLDKLEYLSYYYL